MSFQDELRSRIPAEKDLTYLHNKRVLNEVEETYRKAKAVLIHNASGRIYTVQDGMATVSCIVPMPDRYLHEASWDNFSQVAANNRKLFKDPFLKPNKTKTFSVAPDCQEDYALFCSRMKELAQADDISFSMILYYLTLKWERPFPTRLVGLEECFPDYILAVKCETTFPL